MSQFIPNVIGEKAQNKHNSQTYFSKLILWKHKKELRTVQESICGKFAGYSQ